MTNIIKHTPQEAYDHIITSLITQGEPSIDRGTCLYRLEVDERVLKCAAGHMLPKGVTFAGIEGMSFFDVMRDYDIVCVHPQTADLIAQMQDAHDSAAGVLSDQIDSGPWAQVLRRAITKCLNIGVDHDIWEKYV